MMLPAELRRLMDAGSDSAFLLFDLRVSPQYAQSRIKGALNLCIPTTLLKRATFNLQKLQSTFQNETDEAHFATWREMKSLVVYDAFSSEKRDAVSAMNTIKKFTNEGFTGATYILRGGFNAFAISCPDLVDNSSGDRAPPGLSLATSNGSQEGRPAVAPVIGGVVLPNATSAVNPFFSNIRQNMDLADGVGQMDIALPTGIDFSILPRWLREAAGTRDHGKQVADRFLSIERKEQSRMKEAYSSFNVSSTATPQTVDGGDKVELSGVEKGVKNRYKDILPFDHARVRLHVQEEGACDYVNASHIKASRSNKRYIASQGPLPATFGDFWSVVWDQDVRVIVMLTAESEGGQLKCHPYWKSGEFGPLKLRALSEKKVSLAMDKHRSSSIASEASGFATASVSRANTGFNFPAPASDSSRRRANTVSTAEPPTPASSTSNTSQGLGTLDTPYVIIRKFALSHAAHPFAPIREVTQLHYPSWPDFGAPAQPSHLLALVELANVMQRAAMPSTGSNPKTPSAAVAAAAVLSSPSSDAAGRHGSARWNDVLGTASSDEFEQNATARPMLVHCSAGCGRTGTFCTVDSVIDMMKRQSSRMAGLAARMRTQRGARFNAAIASQSSGPDLDFDGDVTMSGDDDDDDDDQPSSSIVQRPVGSVSMAAPPKPPMLTQSHRMSFYYTGPSKDMSSATPDLVDTNQHTPEQEVKETDNIDLSWLRDEEVDLIAATVADFRTQRLSMVQSLRQFVLCYESVAEWVWRAQERSPVSSRSPE
jgi:protein tyrosine phosphatase